MLFDTHAHYDDKAFSQDQNEVLLSLKNNGVGLVVNAGCNINSSKKSAALAKKYDFVYGAAGIHPHDSANAPADWRDCLRELCLQDKVRALGEIGLDYHYDFSPRTVQRELFASQMELARELGVPVIIHEREACADCLDILKAFPDVRGVMHCYGGSVETAKVLLSMGYYISFTGVITFKNARRTHDAVKYIPNDRIMIETDCPYMTPEPHRGKRNSSAYLGYVCDALAMIRGVTREEAEKQTYQNGKAFFGI